jgi:hypothetical protein
MSAISGAILRALIDSIAAQKIKLDAAVGDTTTAATILYGMQQNADRIAALAENIKTDLLVPAVEVKELMEDFKLWLDHKLIRALENHVREEEGMGVSDYWEQENYPSYRMPPEYALIARAIGQYLKAELCYALVTAMGTFAVSGAGAGTFTDGDAIDGNLYGPSDCELEVITAAGGPGSVSLVATVIGTDENGAEVTGSATFASASEGDKENVTPDQVGKQFQDITDITITGGASGDEFKIQSKVDRAVSL